MKIRVPIITLTLSALSLAAYEGLRVYQANQALSDFRAREVAKVRDLINHPGTGQRDDVSTLIETITADGKITLQEYQWLTGAMVHRYKNIDPRVAGTMLDAGYRTSLELDSEHQQLRRQTDPLVWLTDAI